MIDSLEEFKALVEWARKNHVKRLKYKTLEVELHDTALISQIIEAEESQKSEPLSTSKTMVDTEISNKQEEDDLLYWSAR
jgi:hypothetical protein